MKGTHLIRKMCCKDSFWRVDWEKTNKDIGVFLQETDAGKNLGMTRHDLGTHSRPVHDPCMTLT
jgi:hypothetical protein